MRKFLNGILFMIFVIAALSAIVFGYLFFSRSAEITLAKNDKLNSDIQNSALQQTVTTLTKPRVFKDDGFGVTVTYPFDWEQVLTTNIDTFASADKVSGAIISVYKLTFTKSDATLIFAKHLGGIGGLPFALDQTKIDFQIIPADGVNVVRYTNKGETNWTYVTQHNCLDLPQPVKTVNAVCVNPFFPGFGKALYATSVNLSGTVNPLLLKEADQIVLSAGLKS